MRSARSAALAKLLALFDNESAEAGAAAVAFRSDARRTANREASVAAALATLRAFRADVDADSALERRPVAATTTRVVVLRQFEVSASYAHLCALVALPINGGVDVNAMRCAPETIEAECWAQIDELRAAGALTVRLDAGRKGRGPAEWAAYCLASTSAPSFFAALARTAPAQPKEEYHVTVAFGHESVAALRAAGPPPSVVVHIGAKIVRSRTSKGDLAAVLVTDGIDGIVPLPLKKGETKKRTPHITCWLSGTRNAAGAGAMLERWLTGETEEGETFTEWRWTEASPTLSLDLHVFEGHHMPSHCAPEWHSLRERAAAACAANTAHLGDAVEAELAAIESRCAPLLASHKGAAQCDAMWRVGVEAIRPMLSASLYCSRTAEGAVEYASQSWQHWAWLSTHACVGRHDEEVALWPGNAGLAQGFKVQAASKKRGPDDIVYKKEIDLRRHVPRGLVFVGAKLALYGLRKFFGDGFDEDVDDERFAHLVATTVDRSDARGLAHSFIATRKRNGENVQIAVLRLRRDGSPLNLRAEGTEGEDEGVVWLVVGSKNRKIMVPWHACSSTESEEDPDAVAAAIAARCAAAAREYSASPAYSIAIKVFNLFHLII